MHKVDKFKSVLNNFFVDNSNVAHSTSSNLSSFVGSSFCAWFGQGVDREILTPGSQSWQ